MAKIQPDNSKFDEPSAPLAVSRADFTNNTQELIEKHNPVYSQRELKFIRRILPNLKTASDEEITSKFKTENGLFSVLEIKLLNDFIQRPSTEEAVTIVNDPERFANAVRHIAYSDSRFSRAYLWVLCSILPLSEEVHSYLSDHLPGMLPDKPSSIADVIAAHLDVPSIQRQTLPFGSLPDIRTYFESRRGSSHIEVPGAVISINQPGKAAQNIYLSSKDSALALFLMARIFASGPGPATYFESYLTNKARAGILRILENYKDESALRDPAKCIYNIRFTQYRKGIPKEFSQFLNSKDEIETFLGALSGTTCEGIQSRHKSAPQRIKLSKADEYLKPENITISESANRATNDRKAHVTTSAQEMNELQTAHLEIARATKSGNWDKAAKVYIRYLEEWPQYLEHRMGVLDIFNRVQKGELPFQPKHIVSLASGPHEELRAYFDLSSRFPALIMPIVISVDSSKAMLEESAKCLPAGADIYSRDLVGSVCDVALPKGIFDLVECSSFDSFRSKQETMDVILLAASLLRKGGVLKFLPNNAFSEEFCNALHAAGFKILVKNSELLFTAAARKQIVSGEDENLLQRIDKKLTRHGYFLATLTRPLDIVKLQQLAEDIKEIYSDKRLPQTAGQFKASTGSEETNNKNFNVCLAVALNPGHFLRNVKISVASLVAALEFLEGKIDVQIAREIYRIYLKTKHAPEIEERALETCLSCRDISKFFEFDLLRHANPKVVTKALSYVLNKKETFTKDALASDWLDSDVRKEILSAAVWTQEMNALIRSRLKAGLATADGRKEIARLLACLPENSEINLPLTLRKDEAFAAEYFRICKRSDPKAISTQELDDLFKTFRAYRDGNRMVFRAFGTESLDQDRMTNLDVAIDTALSCGNQALAFNIAGFICLTIENDCGQLLPPSVRNNWASLLKLAQQTDDYNAILSMINYSESEFGYQLERHFRLDAAKKALKNSLELSLHIRLDAQPFMQDFLQNIQWIPDQFRIDLDEYFQIQAEILDNEYRNNKTAQIKQICKGTIKSLLMFCDSDSPSETISERVQLFFDIMHCTIYKDVLLEFTETDPVYQMLLTSKSFSQYASLNPDALELHNFFRVLCVTVSSETLSTWRNVDFPQKSWFLLNCARILGPQALQASDWENIFRTLDADKIPSYIDSIVNRLDAGVIRDLIICGNTQVTIAISEHRLDEVLNYFDNLTLESQKEILMKNYQKIEDPAFFIELSGLSKDTRFLLELGRKSLKPVISFLDQLTEVQFASLLHLRDSAIPIKELESLLFILPAHSKSIKDAIKFTMLEDCINGCAVAEETFMKSKLNEFKVGKLETQSNSGHNAWIQGAFGGKVGFRTVPIPRENFLKFKNCPLPDLRVKLYRDKSGSLFGELRAN